MVDAVTVRKEYEDAKYLRYTLTCISDGTGEAAVVKFDPASFTTTFNMQALAVQYFSIIEVIAGIQGFKSVRILFDATTPTVAMALPIGLTIYNGNKTGGVIDPKSSGYTGKILLTSNGATSGATYDIDILLKKKRLTW